MTTWTTPTHIVAGADLDSGKFNEETVDNLLHHHNVLPVAFTDDGTGTAGFSADTTQCTISVPDQGCDGTLFVWAHLRLDRTNTGDEFRIHIKDNTSIVGSAVVAGGASVHTAHPIAAIAMTSGAGKTVNLTAVRNSGSGTATTYTDGTVNRLQALFIGTP